MDKTNTRPISTSYAVNQDGQLRTVRAYAYTSSKYIDKNKLKSLLATAFVALLTEALLVVVTWTSNWSVRV